MINDIAGTLLSQGILGLVALVLGFVVLQLWRDYKSERDARIAEQKETTRQLLAVHEKVSETVDKLHELGQWLGRQQPNEPPPPRSLTMTMKNPPG